MGIYIYIVINLDHLCGIIPISSKQEFSDRIFGGAEVLANLPLPELGFWDIWVEELAGTVPETRQETGSWFQFFFKHHFLAMMFLLMCLGFCQPPSSRGLTVD